MQHDWIVCDTLYNKDDCAKIIKTCLTNINEEIYDSPALDVKKTSNVSCLNYRHVRQQLLESYEFVVHINKTYFGFDLFNSCDGDVLLLNNYNSDQLAEYEWHKDAAAHTEVYDFKITMLMNLSQQEYKGGELQLFTNGGPKTIDSFANPGSICVFPSWLPHRVTPVTSGARTTLTQFYTGPKIR